MNQFSHARPSLHSKNNYHLIMMYNPFYMMMNLVYQYTAEDFCISVYKGHCVCLVA